jgi:aspartate aminotransferase
MLERFFMKLAERLARIKPSPTLAITGKAKELKAQGKDVISLGAGEPDFDTPENIKQAGVKAILDGQTKYTAVDGVKELKEAICAKLQRENNLKYSPENISVGCGAKHVLFNAFLASLNPGDEVIIPAPFWVSYPDMVNFAEGKPVVVECGSESNFKLTATKLEAAITDKTKWLILNSPNNPTGAAYTKQELAELAEVLRANPHVHVMSDDIYEHIVFDGFKFNTLATVAPDLQARCLVVNGVSKAYSMTGWRIGYAAGDPALIKAMSKIQSQSTSNPTSIAQWAAIEAITGTQSFIKPNQELFLRRRDLVVAGLNKIAGIDCLTPEGAFYVFPSCAGVIGMRTPAGNTINDSTDFAAYLLEEVLVAVVPGSAFGLENHFRISYATSDDILQEALLRIAKAVAALRSAEDTAV